MAGKISKLLRIASIGALTSTVACGGQLVDANGDEGTPVGVTDTAGDDAVTPIPEYDVTTGTAEFFTPPPKFEHVQQTGVAFDPMSGPPYPIVLVHGMGGFTDLGPVEYYYGIKDLYEELGAEVYAPAQPPLASVQVRAEVLRAHVEAIMAETGKRQVHLICHSQGGLDCRRLAAFEGWAQNISSLTTIGTPHYGTPAADLARQAPEGMINPAGKLLGWLLGAFEGEPPEDESWADVDSVEEAAWAPEITDAVFDLSSEGTALFNQTYPSHDAVRMFSVGSVSNLKVAGEVCDDGLLWEAPWRVDAVDVTLAASGLYIGGLSRRENDGLVPTDSMKWGTFLGCLPADHYDQVGQIADSGPALLSGFDHREDLYRPLYDLVRLLEEEPDGELAVELLLETYALEGEAGGDLE